MTVELKASSHLPTRFGTFDLHVFADKDGNEHMAVVMGTPAKDCLVRIHSECATGDILGSWRCDCRDQLELSLQKIYEAGNGMLIYMRGHEGRGIGLANKIKAYALQDKGLDTVDANVKLGFAPDQRDYSAAIGILKHYKLKQIKLLTNNRLKMQALEKMGIKVKEQVPLWIATNVYNDDYIQTKRTRMGHVSPLNQATLVNSGGNKGTKKRMRVKGF